jgi:hypothetical protein
MTKFFFTIGTIFAALLAFGASAADSPAQETVPPAPAPTVRPTVRVVVAPRPKVADLPSEKRIAVDKRPAVSLCVASGSVRVNGWDREEVRAMVAGGGSVGFRIAEKSAVNGKPAWVFVVGFEEPKGAGSEECLEGDLIELDVPRESAVNIKGGTGEIRVDSVGKVKIENISGGILLRNIASGISAVTFEGTILVERSGGQIALASTSGSIVAFDVAQSESGDVFKARTNSGTVTLQAVGHRQVEVNTISGALVFRGGLKAGGQYTFGSQNGPVQLTLASGSNCRVNAWYGAGAFKSEIPLVKPLKAGPSTTGQIGSEESGCNLYLKTTSGLLRIGTEPKPQ